MKRVWALLVAAVLVVPFLIPQQVSAQTNPRIGTWKLSVEKSKYTGAKPPKSETRTYAAAADGAIVLTVNTVLADGTKETSGYTAKYDGKDYPFKSPAGDTIAIKRIDDYASNSTVKRNGKVSQTTHATVSKDGKTMTLMTKGTDAAGKPFSNVRVFEKQ